MYPISTREFRLNDQYLHIFSSVHGTKKVPLEKINFIKISYGNLVRNPKVTIFFAMILFIGPALIINYIAGLENHEWVESLGFEKATTFLFTLIVFLIFMGCWSIYQVVQSRIILKVETSDGTTYKFKLKEIIDDQKLPDLLNLLAKYFSISQVEVTKEIEQKYVADLSLSFKRGAY